MAKSIEVRLQEKRSELDKISEQVKIMKDKLNKLNQREKDLKLDIKQMEVESKLSEFEKIETFMSEKNIRGIDDLIRILTRPAPAQAAAATQESLLRPKEPARMNEVRSNNEGVKSPFNRIGG